MLNRYKSDIVKLLDQFCHSQEDVMKEAASAIVDAIANGGKCFAVGSGHSHMVGEEFYSRAGGLACIQLIAPMELTVGEHPTKSTRIERISEYAHIIIMQYKISENDIVIISSNSGRNGFSIEMAMELKRRGIKTIAFTNLEHSKTVTSRHASGKRLFEVCDFVIDNCGCHGDAFVQIEGVRGKMGSTSSIMGMFMAQSLSLLIAEELVSRDMEVPVFLSSNVDEGDAWNKSIMEKYYNI